MIYNSADAYIGRSLELYGEYSEGEVEFFRQAVAEDDVVLDVGANIGVHTVFFAQHVGSGGRVIAFEPQRILFQILSGNIALNGLTNVFAHQWALGAEQGHVLVPDIDYSCPNNFGGLSLGDFDIGEEVEVRTIDSLVLDDCRLIKIDVEGMELDVLRGASATIERFHPVLYVENDRPEKSDDLVRFIDRLGYAMWWHCPRYFNPNNFFGNADNVFGTTVSHNMLCLPRSKNYHVENLSPVSVPHRDSTD